MKKRSILAGALFAALTLLSPTISHAQICSGSNLNYIVRNAKGVPLDAGNAALKFEINNGSPSGEWKKTSHWGGRYYGEGKLPANIKALGDKTAALGTEGMCIFKVPVKLSLTYNGKTMNLTFITGASGEYDSRNFLIDSLPFQAGNFEINLPKEGFYPAAGWKKVTGK